LLRCQTLGPLLDPADVPHGVHRLRPDEEAVAGLGRRRPPALDPILERPLEDVDDLLARMLVSDRRRLRVDFDAVLDQLASEGAEIVLLERGVRLIPASRTAVSLLVLPPQDAETVASSSAVRIRTPAAA